MGNNRRCIRSRSSNLCNNNKRGNAIGSWFFSMPPIEFSLLSSLIGIILIDHLDLNEQNSLGNFLLGAGTSLLTAAAQGELLESQNEKTDQSESNHDNNSTEDDIHQQIKLLKEQLDRLERRLGN